MLLIKIPPEIKDALVAWYSPVKQKLSNYDVIESYIIDFTTFNNRDDAIINNNKFVFTGNVIVGINYERIQVEKYNSYKILIKGLTGVIYYYYRNVDGVENYIIFNKDGVYDIPVSYKQGTEGVIMGYTCDSTTECTVTQLPTSILKDFSGNKHNAYLYGFKGKLNSGVGIYAQDFKNWNCGSTINNDISTKSYNKIHIVKKKADNWFGFTIGIPKNNYYNQSYKLKFNINKKIDDIKFSLVSTDGNLQSTQVYSVNINDGSVIDIPIISEEIFNNKEETNIYYDFGTNKDIEIDIELIANYPNQLCYDGKSYAVAYGLPILTDYTVIANRTWFAEKVDNGVFMSKALEQNGAFILEYKQGDKWNTYSYYSATNINIDKDNSIVYQTKNKYNEQTIYSGDKQDTDTLFKCADHVQFVNDMWRTSYNQQNQRFEDRQTINQEMFGIYSAMRNGFDIINATANKNAFDLYKYSRDNKDELAGQIGELKTEVAVLKATRPYQDALIQCDIRRVAEHADFNLWRRTCRMISGEVVLPNTPTVTGYASYNPCDCRNNSTQTPAA